MKYKPQGLIGSHYMRKMIKDWLKDNKVTKIEHKDWDKARDGQTSGVFHYRPSDTKSRG